ncbi:CapA family protein [Legionella shakespearei]|uniref:Capsule biosynthesis protein n=1 Tax=Legionella shakespearei DSM 23087 TaxID=1122169 RepID=A0A0W0YKY6_9GAMM|nr:CapA family protein [Legionella shakespearei]KTD57222.1 capsule biosynthesis protein [Legionella shakespearei DSM 23087]
MTPDMKWYQHIRYEYQRWPLWRWDLNWAYIRKSFKHRCDPLTLTDFQHYQAMRQWTVNYLAANTGCPERHVNIAAVGDIMWIREGWQNALSPGVKDVLSKASLTINNMETPIAPNKPVPRLVYETFHYNAPVEYLDNWQGLPASSQHLFSLCNNHALDQGVEGLEATRQAILAKDARFHCIGGAGVDEDYQIVSLDGITIGVFSASFGINHLKAGAAPPQSIPVQHFGNSHQSPDWERIKKTLHHLKAHCDFIIFYPHWGYEYEYWPDQLQRDHALTLIELGVDVIIGHSPHVLQPIDYVSINHFDPACPLQVEREGAAKLGMIAWSLGNFLSIMPTLACKTGVILQLSLTHTGKCWSVDKAMPVPVFTGRPEKGGMLQRGVMLLSELPQKHLNKKSQILAHCHHLFPIINDKATL